MVVALKPLHDAATIKRVVVATYQSVSGAGKSGMDELFEQTRNIFVGDSADIQEVHQADRLQRDPAHRQLPRRRVDQGRVEDGRRDQEDP
jgi:aspartate-semialdehyde dehydrogenase